MKPVDLVGHSVGGAIASLVATQIPGRVNKLVNIEGNFTLQDAFWSASIGRMTVAEAERMLRGFRSDPALWLNRAGLAVTPSNLALASSVLNFQPARTLIAMGKSVVEVTSSAAYHEVLKETFLKVPAYLMAGARSRATWHIPAWAIERAAAEVLIPDAGHMLMLEQPMLFAHELSRILAE